MDNVVKKASMSEIFNAPRILYGEMIRKRLASELKGALTLMRFYRQHHSDVILVSHHACSADEIINNYEIAMNKLSAATALSEIREVHAMLAQLRGRYNQAIESVLFSMAMIHGYED